MALRTLTLASIYESQGLKEDASEIYREILGKEPGNIAARLALRRLNGKPREFAGANREMAEFFINMDSPAEFLEFERWLIFD